MHAKVIRPYSHSLSDDERLYKTPEEREAEAKRDPLVRMRAFLLAEKLATEADLDDCCADVDRQVLEATDRALEAPKPAVDTADLYVFSPDVDPTSSAFETPEQPTASPTRWSPPSTAR